MRLLILPLMLAALPASAAAPTAPNAAADTCKRPDLRYADTRQRAESRKLGELPPGDTLLAVYNQVEGCMEPLIVRYGEGRAPASPPPEPLPRARLWR